MVIFSWIFAACDNLRQLPHQQKTKKVLDMCIHATLFGMLKYDQLNSL